MDCPDAGGIKSLTDILNFFTCLLKDSILPLLVTLAVVGFVYGIVKFFLNPDSEEKRKEGKNFMFWGIFALFAIVSVWGLVGILTNTFLPKGAGNFMPAVKVQ
jgi:uncharacterized membrane protein